MRFITHPLLINKKSRNIFLIYFSFSFVVGCWILWKVNAITSLVGVASLGTFPTGSLLQRIVWSSSFQWGAIFLASVLGAAYTAYQVVGPIERIERWLKNLSAGRKVADLKVRKGDKFEKLVLLVNSLNK